MVSSSVKQYSGALVFVGLLAAAAAVTLWVRPLARGDRAATSDADEAPVAASSGSASASSAGTVRLSREHLDAAGIEVEPVRSRPMENTIVCNGNADFNQNKYVAVPPRAEGILSKIYVDVGAAVQAGDVLAVVNSQTTGDLKASYIKTLIHEQHLRWQVEKLKEAVDGIAAKNLFEAQHLLEEQLADTARFKDRLDNFGFSEEEIAAIVEKKDTSPRLTVIAPRAGVVVERKAVEGEPVRPDVRLFAIADLDTMWVNLSAYEHQLPQVRLGQSVTFYPDGLPGEGFAGKVTWISPAMDLTTRTIHLRAEVTNRDGKLRANMFGKGELLAEPAHEGLVVPQSAVQSHQGYSIVFVEMAGNMFEARRVVVGVKRDQFWEVTSGLRPGENVATTGSFLLKSNLENPEFGAVE